MDIKLIQGALAGLVPIEALTIPERLAYVQAQAEVRRVSISQKASTAPVRFLLPEYIERLYRGRSP